MSSLTRTCLSTPIMCLPLGVRCVKYMRWGDSASNEWRAQLECWVKGDVIFSTSQGIRVARHKPTTIVNVVLKVLTLTLIVLKDPDPNPKISKFS